MYGNYDTKQQEKDIRIFFSRFVKLKKIGSYCLHGNTAIKQQNNNKNCLSLTFVFVPAL